MGQRWRDEVSPIPEYLHSDNSVIHHNFFRQEVGADCCFVAGTEFFVDLEEQEFQSDPWQL